MGKILIMCVLASLRSLAMTAGVGEDATTVSKKPLILSVSSFAKRVRNP